MKKKVLTIAGGVLLLGGAFSLGNISKGHADLDWSTNAQNRAYNELLDTKNEVAGNLLDDTATDITQTLDGEVTSTVDTNADELKRLMEQYYQMKLDGLTETPEFKALEEKINQIMLNVYGSYKTDVDNAFKEVGF